eukprot:1030449-Prorocentrum_minimum.AAC.1
MARMAWMDANIDTLHTRGFLTGGGAGEPCPCEAGPTPEGLAECLREKCTWSDPSVWQGTPKGLAAGAGT